MELFKEIVIGYMPIYIISIIFNYYQFRAQYIHKELLLKENLGSMIGLVFTPFLNTLYAGILFLNLVFKLDNALKNENLDLFFVLNDEQIKERNKKHISLRKR